MNRIEDLLKNHSETPSEEVWKRLNARLDAEMPVVNSPVQSAGFTKFRRVAIAALVASVLIGYGKHRGNRRGIVAARSSRNNGS